MLHGSVSEVVHAPPQEVFARVTDIERLPEWNEIVKQVLERPTDLGPGSEWVVEMKALGGRWNSRAFLEEIDRASMRMSHRSMSDDGNPSYALWNWRVEGSDDESTVTVSWELHPKTFWRRVLLVRLRHRMLRREVRSSLMAMDRAFDRRT